MQYLVDSLFDGGMASGVMAIIFYFLLIMILKMIIRVGLPNKILVVTGKKSKKAGKAFGFSVEYGRTTVIPYLQQIGYLDSEVLPVNVTVDGVNSANGITVGADATACVCIDRDDDGMVYSAVEKLMGKGRNQIHEQIQQTLVGNFRGALNKATPLQAMGMEDVDGIEVSETLQGTGERAQFRHELMQDINNDLDSFGMKVVSVSLQNIWDSSNYIANLAQKTLAQKRQEVEIQEARLRAEADRAESDAKRRIEIAKSQADESIIAADQKLEVYRRESEGVIKAAKLDADNSISEALNIGQKAVQEKLNVLQQLLNQSNVILKAEAERRAAEILASGQAEAITIKESAKNNLLKQKVALLHNNEVGKMILFIQQQLPNLFSSFKKHAEATKVESLVIMDKERGFKGAVNRGPEVFVDFLQKFKESLGIDVKELLEQHSKSL